MTPAVTPAPHKNRFIGFWEHIGHDLKVGLPVGLKIAETGGEVAVSIFAPAASALFNQTVSAIATAQQNALALNGGMTGPQKMAAVIQLMGGLIEQGLRDANQPAALADVTHYIEAALTIAKATVISVPAAPQIAQVSAPPVPIAQGEQGNEQSKVLPMASPGETSGPSAMDSLLGR